MPELPEVETTRRGLAPHLEGRTVTGVCPAPAGPALADPDEVRELLPGQRIAAVRRRAKYLLLDTSAGSALLHLGMSGSLRVLPAATPVKAHDHVDLALDSRRVLRFTDPRRFGCLLWQPPGTTHELLRDLGPEPLSDAFDGDYLFALSRGRKAPVKTFLMDQKIVVGVGNIYVRRGPVRSRHLAAACGGKVSRERYALLARRSSASSPTPSSAAAPPCAISSARRRTRLLRAGTVGLRPGRRALPALRRALKQATIGQRTTVWCGHCQK
jgi:formamidopyrimidine-DNA glycosylase